MKRTREEKYRIKIIQENHYDKIEQRIIDREVKIRKMSYKELYICYTIGVYYSFMAAIAMRRVSKALCAIGLPAADLNEKSKEVLQIIL